MIAKSSKVALVVSSVLMCQGAHAQTTADVGNLASKSMNAASSVTDVASAFQVNSQQNGVYIIQLAQKSALDKSYSKLGDERKTVVTAIEAEQEQLIQAIKQLDPEAVVLAKVKMVDNALHVQLKNDAVDTLKQDSRVKQVIKTTQNAEFTELHAYKPYPHLQVNDAGDDITVAIIGNGVDYTHANLGGVGSIEAYEQARKNKSNAWDGFPTDTVIGGLDFSAAFEGWHTVDYNPIEDEEDVNVATGYYPSGTAQASLILEQAPEAKILAYKTLDWAWTYFYPVLDFVIDPNQDGNVSDRPDILVINAFGSGAFYQEQGDGRSHSTMEIDHMRRLAGLGSLLVTPAGTHYYDSFYNLSSRGATPEALTVGSVSEADGQSVLSAFSPAGPTRGDTYLKPEVVAPGENLTGALTGTGDQQGELGSSSAYAAAYTAGVAARAWAAQPELSALEIKALVANTATHENISGKQQLVEGEGFSVDITTVAEVPFIGSGKVSGDNAVNASAVMWETSTYQPGLAFGFQEVKSSSSETRQVTVKNLTDTVQTYLLSSHVFGNKDSNNAIGLLHPQSVSVPAHQSVTFPVTVTIDAHNLGKWPVSKTGDYSVENWIEAGVNGYLTLQSDDNENAQSVLKMPWMVFPKSNMPFRKSDYRTQSSLPFNASDWMDKVYQTGQWIESNVVNVTNNSNNDRTLFTMPLMRKNQSRPDTKEDSQGHMIKSLGATIYENAQCSSNSALAISVEMFDTFELPMAEHFDKAGATLAYFSIYDDEFVDEYGPNPFELEIRSSEETRMAFMEIIMNSEGEPITQYINYNMEYNPFEPDARRTQSSLPTYVSPGGRVAIANVCVDELYHHSFQSPEDFNALLGWQFATDRDAQSTLSEDVIRYNPVLHGSFKEEVVDHTGQTGYPNFWDTWTPCAPQEWDPNYCLEEKSTFLASIAAMTLIDDNMDPVSSSWTHQLTVPAGQSARVAGAVTLECNPNVVSIGPVVINENCPPGVAMFEVESSDVTYLTTTTGYDKSPVKNQSFTVYENSENGTVVGVIANTSDVLFINSDSNKGDMFLMNSLPGTPFSVDMEGTIRVLNSEAIDFEQQNQFVLKVQTDHINRASEVIDVTINVTNQNDIAPIQIEALPEMEAQAGASVALDLSNHFTDIEGDGLTFFAEQLPEGLNLSKAGMLSGTPVQPGQYSVQITVTDSINSVQVAMPITVNASNESLTPPEKQQESSAGSNSALALMMIALVLIRRRLTCN